MTDTGDLVRLAREAAGMTQEQFAEAYGFEVKTLRNWEQGVRARMPRHVQVYLKLIASDPKRVARMIAGG
jgi:DNA-binding transcriptional regulator YiaG